MPTGTFALAGPSANQPVFNGTGEAGTTISLAASTGEIVGKAVADSIGNWAIAPGPLGNGNYSVSVRSSDAADNITLASAPLVFTINSTLNRSGSAGNDMLAGTTANNAIDGLGGLDTAVYGGKRAAYTVAQSTNGFTAKSAAETGRG